MGPVLASELVKGSDWAGSGLTGFSAPSSASVLATPPSEFALAFSEPSYAFTMEQY
jgi:hypothetical protein